MILKWLIQIFWLPFMRFSYWFPIIPLNIKVEEIVDGIELFRIDNFATKILSKFAGNYEYATFYIIDKSVMFDTGFAWSARSLKKYFNENKNYSIEKIVISHAHEDHYGNAVLMQDFFPDAKVLAHKKAIKEIKYPKQKSFYRYFIFGPDIPIDVEILEDKTISTNHRDLEVVFTPGHTPGHIVLYDKQNRVLLSGDLFISEDVDTQLHEVNGMDWIRSLEDILRLDLDYILDGHGKILKSNECQNSLCRKMEYLKVINMKVVSEIEKGPISEKELLVSVFNDSSLVNKYTMREGWMSAITGGDFSRSHLVRSFIKSYLDR